MPGSSSSSSSPGAAAAALVAVLAAVAAVPSAARGGAGAGGDPGDPRIPHQVLSTLAPAADTPGAFQVSFATERRNASESAPAASGVLYWSGGGGPDGPLSAPPAFAPADVTAYVHSGVDVLTNVTFGRYESEWQHHVVIDDAGVARPGSVVNYRPVRDRDDADTFGEVFAFTVPPLASALGGDPEQRTVLGLIGDLGQTDESRTTMAHLSSHVDASAVLLVGDLSYADCEQARWDSWREMVSSDFARVPLLSLPGNHEEELDPEDGRAWKPYASRFRMAPGCADCGGYAHDGWAANMWYSVPVGSATVVALSSYHNFTASSEQFAWLERTLDAVDRAASPWLIVSMHAPWYNSNVKHQDEPESVGMRAAMEGLLHRYAVDIVFAGHVHSYERVFATYRNATDASGPVYINIGDGGNREGIYNVWLPGADGEARPRWSALRAGSYGHGILTLMDSRRAAWSWHRNEDPDWAIGDFVLICNKVNGCGSASSRSGARNVLADVTAVFGALLLVGAAALVVYNRRAFASREPLLPEHGGKARGEIETTAAAPAEESEVLLHGGGGDSYDST